MGMSEIIQKMKVFLQNEIPAEVQMTDVKTKNGIILSFEGELVSGIEIFIVDETGKNPASDGEYILEDGQTIIVAEGKVAEVKMPEDPIEAPEIEAPETEDVLPVAEMVEEPIVEEKPIEKPIEDDRIKKMEDEIAQIKNILSELVKQMGKTELKEEIKQDLKLSKIKIKSEEKIEMNTNGTNGVQNILRNIYKK